LKILEVRKMSEKESKDLVSLKWQFDISHLTGCCDKNTFVEKKIVCSFGFSTHDVGRSMIHCCKMREWLPAQFLLRNIRLSMVVYIRIWCLLQSPCRPYVAILR
jgi:hypothetical protein